MEMRAWRGPALLPIALLYFGAAPGRVAAQGTAPLGSRAHFVGVDSGWVENDGAALRPVFSAVILQPGAVWLRLRFGEVALSGDPAAGNASFLRVTSLADGAWQHLEAHHVRQWRSTSAYFNGDAVLVELFAHPASGPSRVEVREVIADDSSGGAQRSLCGDVDDRTLSQDPSAARVMPIGCTAWIVDQCGRCLLTAGHCDPALDVVQFNVPLSNTNGSVNHPPPDDQYAVDPASVQSTGNSSVGDDWAYFGVYPNSNTGLTPYEAQGAAVALAAGPPTPTGQSVQVTGYGTVTAPVPLTWNQVQKAHAGPFTAAAGATLYYQADTTSGNSGSALIELSTGAAIGVHTHGGCNDSGGNRGTAIDHADLRAALAHPRGVCAQGGLTFTFPEGLPEVIDPDGGAAITAVIAGAAGIEPVGQTARLHWRLNGGPVEFVAMQESEGSYVASFGPLACGTRVEYFVSAEATDGQRYYEPGGCFEPAQGVSAVVARSLTVLAADSMESGAGWTVGSPQDTATSGAWVPMAPQATIAQPPADHSSSGSACWVTGGLAGTNYSAYDVDGGQTTLTSPPYDLSAWPDAEVRYWRWFSNHAGTAAHEDVLEVYVSADGTNWVLVETVGPDGPESFGGWYEHRFRVADFVSPGAAVRLRFVAADFGADSTVEAAIDDLRIELLDCSPPPCPGDVDGDRMIGLADVSTLLSNFGSTGDVTYADGDLTGDAAVDLADLSALLEVFGLKCP